MNNRFAEYLGKVVVIEYGNSHTTFIGTFFKFDAVTGNYLFNAVYNVTRQHFSANYSRMVADEHIASMREATAVENSLYQELWKR